MGSGWKTFTIGQKNKGRKKEEYFIAVRSGLGRNYDAMAKIFDEVIEWSLRL